MTRIATTHETLASHITEQCHRGILTIRLLRELYSLLNFLFRCDTFHSTQPQSTTTEERRSSRDELLVAQPELNSVLLALLQVRYERTCVDSAKAEESFALWWVVAEFDNEFAIDEQISCAGDVETDIPIAIFVRSEVGGVLNEGVSNRNTS